MVKLINSWSFLVKLYILMKERGNGIEVSETQGVSLVSTIIFKVNIESKSG